MRKILFFVFVFLIFTQSSLGQVFIKQQKTPKFVFGFHSNGHIESMTDPATSIHRYLYLIDTQLHASYFPVRNLGFGLMYEYMYTKSNYTYFPSFYSYGFYLRYYSSLKIDKPILNRFKFFAETNLNRANYKIETRNVYPTVFDKANQTILKFPIGLQFQIWKGLHYETALEYTIFIGGLKFLNPRIGFEYHFNRSVE